MSVSIGPRVVHPKTPAGYANNVGVAAGKLYDAANAAAAVTEDGDGRKAAVDLAIFASDIRGLERPGMPDKFLEAHGPASALAWAKGNISDFRPLERRYEAIFGGTNADALSSAVTQMGHRLEQLKEALEAQ